MEFCLITNGAYLGVGSFLGAGDCGEMLRQGSPVWVLRAFGAVAVPIGLWLWSGQGPKFGLGDAKGKVSHRVTYGCLVIFSLLVLLGLVVDARMNDRAPGQPDTAVTMTRVSQTCLICRLTRVDTTSAQQTTTEYEENECSRWYAANVEPSHKHVWEDSTCTFASNADGTPAFVACNPGHFAIWLLSPETQLAAYQHFKNPVDARDLFLSLADAKTYNDRLDEHDEDKGHLIVEALEEWEAAGFPGTWKEWWQPWYAKHLEEHKEYLTWLHSDSGLNFSDWQSQRKASRAPAAAAANSKK